LGKNDELQELGTKLADIIRRKNERSQKQIHSISTYSAESANSGSSDESDFDDLEALTLPGANEKIREEQLKETGWSEIIKFLKGEIQKPSRRLSKVAGKFALRQQLLHRQVENESGPYLALVVPQSMVPVVLHKAHDSIFGAHLGIRRTTKRVKSQYYWPRLAKDVADYVNSCITCHMFKANTRKAMGELIPLQVTSIPFEKIAIDKFGPIMNSSSGHAYVFIAVDYCTRYVIAKSTKTGKSSEAAEFVEPIILEHRPSEILTDNGSEFKDEFHRVLEKHGIKHIKSSPHHPRANGLVERANKSISQIMRTLIQEPDHSDWSDSLPLAVTAYNHSIHEVTGFTPHFLLYGYEPRRENLLNEQLVALSRNSSCAINVQTAREQAVERTEKQRMSEKARYDKHRRPVDIKPGDLVMVEVTIHKKGASSRFMPRRKGPFRVIRVFDNNTIEIRGNNEKTAKLNAENCLKIRERPEHLIPFDEVAEVVENTARGQASSSGEAGDTWHSDNPDNANCRPHIAFDLNDFWNPPTESVESERIEENIAELQPLRRSSRKTRKPERLIEVMRIETRIPLNPTTPVTPVIPRTRVCTII
jgi:transposase InsO family protein